jgi:hypothetical protein
MDPRLPDTARRFGIALAAGPEPLRVSRLVDGDRRAATAQRAWLWPMEPGTHTAQGRVHAVDGSTRGTTALTFHVR